MNPQANIGYTGIVELSNSNKNVRIRNSGTPKLFDTIAQLLQYSDNKENLLPKYMSIGIETDKITPIVSSTMAIYSRDVDLNTHSISYKATLYKAALKQAVDNSTEYKLGLYSSNNDLLAIVKINGSSINQLFSNSGGSPVTQALIKWTLSFNNQTS